MSNYISFSQISKYTSCARSYKYYYVDKLREKSASAFLAFGSAMDDALNGILNDLKLNGEVTIDYKASFDSKWQKITINKREYDLPKCTLVGYAKADWVSELLTKEDREELNNILSDQFKNKDLDEVNKILEEMKSNSWQFPFEKQDHEALNFMNWLSMRRKGHAMLDAYLKDIIPRIDVVRDVQRKIELSSGDGTKLIGFVDAVVKFKGDTEYSVLDNKTSAMPYDLNKVKYSQQLALYCYELGLSKASFGVMIKNIKLNKEKTCSVCGHDGSGRRHKSCDKETVDGGRCDGSWLEVVRPEAVTQLIQGIIDKHTQEMVIETAAEVLDAIKAKVFVRNLNTCSNIYGSPCPYLKMCYAGKSDNLEIVQ